MLSTYVWLGGGCNSYVYDITVIICLIYKEERENIALLSMSVIR